MIEFKVKAKNCNRGQLFRHCWVSSAWISKEWCTCNKLIDWSSIPAQFGLYHVVAPLSFLRSISLAALFLVYKKGKAREISKVNCNYQLSFIYLVIMRYLLLFNLCICTYIYFILSFYLQVMWRLIDFINLINVDVDVESNFELGKPLEHKVHLRVASFYVSLFSLLHTIHHTAWLLIASWDQVFVFFLDH